MWPYVDSRRKICPVTKEHKWQHLLVLPECPGLCSAPLPPPQFSWLSSSMQTFVKHFSKFSMGHNSLTPHRKQ